MFRSLVNRPLLGLSRSILRPSRLLTSNPFLIPIKNASTIPTTRSQITPLSQHFKFNSNYSRQFSTTSMTNFTRPPRFNARPPSTISLIWHLIPDGFKIFLALMGTASFIMFIAAPLIIIILPPLFIGGYFASKFWIRRRNNDMKKRWDNMLKTHLTYEGSELDQIRLKDFTLERLVDAFETNEQGITDFFDSKSDSQHHSFSSRFKLTGIETIDQDFRISKMGIQESISVMSFGLIDKDSRIGRIATVVLTLRPRNITSLLEVGNLEQDAVIEIKPVFNAFGKSFFLNTKSGFSKNSSDRIIDIHPHNTRRYK